MEQVFRFKFSSMKELKSTDKVYKRACKSANKTSMSIELIIKDFYQILSGLEGVRKYLKKYLMKKNVVSMTLEINKNTRHFIHYLIDHVISPGKSSQIETTLIPKYFVDRKFSLDRIAQLSKQPVIVFVENKMRELDFFELFSLVITDSYFILKDDRTREAKLGLVRYKGTSAVHYFSNLKAEGIDELMKKVIFSQNEETILPKCKIIKEMMVRYTNIEFRCQVDLSKAYFDPNTVELLSRYSQNTLIISASSMLVDNYSLHKRKFLFVLQLARNRNLPMVLSSTKLANNMVYRSPLNRNNLFGFDISFEALRRYLTLSARNNSLVHLGFLEKFSENLKDLKKFYLKHC